MDFDGNIIYILFAIGYFVFKVFFSNKDDKKKKAPAQPSSPPPAYKPTENKPQEPTLEDVFETLFNKPKAQPTPAPVAAPKATHKAAKVQPSHISQSHSIKPKSRRIVGDAPIDLINLDSDGEPDYVFDIDNINWKDAVISKEILDRKYT